MTGELLLLRGDERERPAEAHADIHGDLPAASE
jgi:hypothetical protein